MNLDRLSVRIRTLLETHSDNDVALTEALAQNLWVINSLGEFSKSEQVATVSRELDAQISKAMEVTDEQAFAEVRRLAIWVVELDEDSRRKIQPALKLASIQAVVTMVASIAAILIGRVGIVQLLLETPNNSASISKAAPPSDPSKEQQEDKSNSQAQSGLEQSESESPDDTRMIHAMLVLHVLQAMVILLLVVLGFTPFLTAKGMPDDHAASTDAKIKRGTLHQFTWGWRVVWWSWLLFYSWKAVEYVLRSRDPGLSDEWTESISDILQLPNLLAFIWCFLVLDTPSVKTNLNRRRDKEFITSVIWTFTIALAVTVLSVCDRWQNLDLGDVGVFLLSLYFGVAVAFFVGRLDSKWIDCSRWMLVPLYGYAVIQLAYFSFDKVSYGFRAGLYAFALVLKLALFLVVAHMLRTGRLSNYIDRYQVHEATTTDADS